MLHTEFAISQLIRKKKSTLIYTFYIRYKLITINLQYKKSSLSRNITENYCALSLFTLAQAALDLPPYSTNTNYSTA